MALSLHLQKESEMRFNWRTETLGRVAVRFRRRRLFSRTAAGVLKNISGKGLSFVTAQKLKKGKTLQLEIQTPPAFPGFHRISLPVTILRVSQSQTGKEFTAACTLEISDEKSREAIRQLIWWLELNSRKQASARA